MKETRQGLKHTSFVALVALLLLLIGALYYYKERMLFADASYIAFNTINNGKLYIQELRFGSFITQGMPLLLAKLHLPIKVVLLGYSASFNLFFIVVALFLVGYRSYGLAVLMSLYYFLFVSDTYYWTNNEIHQAVAWMFLFFGTAFYLARRQSQFWIQLLAFLLLGTVTVFTHFLVVIPGTFLWVYLMLNKEDWPFDRKQTLIFSSLFLAIVVVKYIISITQPYDGPHLHDPTHATLPALLSTFNNSLIKAFLERCLTNYWITTLVFVAGTITAIMKRQYRALSWTLACTLAYIVAMKLTFGDYKDVPLYYIESEWASLGIVVAAPFVFSLLASIKSDMAVATLLLIFIVRSVYILDAAPRFEKRTLLKEQVLAQMERKQIKKLVLNDSSLAQKYPGAWSMPDETILLSSLDGDLPRKTFLFSTAEIPGRVSAAGNRDMIDCYWYVAPEHMNKTYFAVDTTTPYKIMTMEELFK